MYVFHIVFQFPGMGPGGGEGGMGMGPDGMPPVMNGKIIVLFLFDAFL